MKMSESHICFKTCANSSLTARKSGGVSKQRRSCKTGVPMFWSVLSPQYVMFCRHIPRTQLSFHLFHFSCLAPNRYLMDGVDSLVKRSVVLDYVTPGSAPVSGVDPVVTGSAPSVSIPTSKTAATSSPALGSPPPQSGLSTGEKNSRTELRSASPAGRPGSETGSVSESQRAAPAAGTTRAAAVFVTSKVCIFDWVQ